MGKKMVVTVPGVEPPRKAEMRKLLQAGNAHVKTFTLQAPTGSNISKMKQGILLRQESGSYGERAAVRSRRGKCKGACVVPLLSHQQQHTVFFRHTSSPELDSHVCKSMSLAPLSGRCMAVSLRRSSNPPSMRNMQPFQLLQTIHWVLHM